MWGYGQRWLNVPTFLWVPRCTDSGPRQHDSASFSLTSGDVWPPEHLYLPAENGDNQNIDLTWLLWGSNEFIYMEFLEQVLASCPGLLNISDVSSSSSSSSSIFPPAEDARLSLFPESHRYWILNTLYSLLQNNRYIQIFPLEKCWLFLRLNLWDYKSMIDMYVLSLAYFLLGCLPNSGSF